MQNLKTTVFGILTLLGTLSSIILYWHSNHQLPSDPTVLSAYATAIATGIGLLTARDSKPTDLNPTQQVALKQIVNQITPPVTEGEPPTSSLSDSPSPLIHK